MYESMLNFPNPMFGEFERLRRDLENMFGSPAVPGSIRSVAAGAAPAVNIGRTPTSFEVYVFAPGLDPAKVDVTIDRGVLHIAGERASAIPDDGQAVVYARERAAGAFRRTVALPDEVDPTQVRASYRDGLLQVSLPRRESAQPKRITVQ